MPSLRERAAGHPARYAVGRAALAVAERLNRRVYLPLEYPPSAANRPRWGHDTPSHAGLERAIAQHDSRYRETLELIRGYRDDLLRIDRSGEDSLEPVWRNGTIPGLDGAAIYAFLRSRAPARYVEVGSGNSTKFAARARRDGRLATRITSIDPQPRAGIDALCDEIVRAPLETGGLDAFRDLEAGDIVFFDGSHRVFMNSDVTVFFLELLPELPAGTLVAVHDVYLPDDYPADAEVADRFWSEQYLLASYLLAEAPFVNPVLPASYVSRVPQFEDVLAALWDDPRFADVEPYGGAFWFTT